MAPVLSASRGELWDTGLFLRLLLAPPPGPWAVKAGSPQARLEDAGVPAWQREGLGRVSARGSARAWSVRRSQAGCAGQGGNFPCCCFFYLERENLFPCEASTVSSPDSCCFTGSPSHEQAFWAEGGRGRRCHHGAVGRTCCEGGGGAGGGGDLGARSPGGSAGCREMDGEKLRANKARRI